jgi:hypothetical protein
MIDSAIKLLRRNIKKVQTAINFNFLYQELKTVFKNHRIFGLF